MKLTKKLLILTTAAASLLTACGGGGNDNSPVTKISIYSFNGGVGNVWLDNAIAEFTALKEGHSYEEGKSGVKITWWGDTHAAGAINRMGSSGDALLFTEKGDTPYSLPNRGLSYDITEIDKSKADESEAYTIEEKLDSSYLGLLTGQDGKYYALPHYEWYPGLTYDVTAFDNGGVNPFYFAAPEETEVNEYTAITEGYNFGTANFIATLEGKKSCGNDGVYGTDDDGLPSSVQEFLILCSYLKSQGITPLAFPGNHRDYTAYLLQGFLTALVGKEGIHDFYDFEGTLNALDVDANGKIQFKAGEELFCEGSGIPAPKVVTKTVTEKTGYLTRETYERYYLAGLMKMLVNCGFFTDKAMNTSANNLQTQKGFINSVKQYACAMLIEGSYWFNESINEGYFEKYYKENREERHVAWMSLPSTFTGSVSPVNEGEEAHKTPLLDTGYSYCFVNKNAMVKGSEGYREAVADFVKFLYTDYSLKEFTKASGACKAGFEYDYTSEEVLNELKPFQQTLMNLKKSNGVVYAKASNTTFKSNQLEFQFGIEAPIWQATIGSTTYKDYISVFYNPDNPNISVASTVEGSFISSVNWANNIYKGN